MSYFLRTLLLFGWLPSRHRSDVSPMADVIVARRSQGLYEPSRITLPPGEAATWSQPEEDHRFTTGRSVMSCDRSANVAAVEFCLGNPAPFDLVVTLAAGASVRQVPLPPHTHRQHIRIAACGWQGQVTISSPTWIPAHALGGDDRRVLGVAVHWVRLQAEA